MKTKRLSIRYVFIRIAGRIGKVSLFVKERDRIIVEHSAIAVDIVADLMRGRKSSGMDIKTAHCVGQLPYVRDGHRCKRRWNNCCVKLCSDDEEVFKIGSLNICKRGARFPGIRLFICLSIKFRK